MVRVKNTLLTNSPQLCHTEIYHKKEVYNMPTDRESNEIKKSMAYDLLEIIESASDKETYTPEEIKTIIKAYITGLTQR